MNALWHHQHPLVRNATFAQRIAWHREHQAQCGCRPVPLSLRKQLEDKLSARPKSAKSS